MYIILNENNILRHELIKGVSNIDASLKEIYNKEAALAVIDEEFLDFYKHRFELINKEEINTSIFRSIKNFIDKKRNKNVYETFDNDYYHNIRIKILDIWLNIDKITKDEINRLYIDFLINDNNRKRKIKNFFKFYGYVFKSKWDEEYIAKKTIIEVKGKEIKKYNAIVYRTFYYLIYDIYNTIYKNLCHDTGDIMSIKFYNIIFYNNEFYIFKTDRIDSEDIFYKEKLFYLFKKNKNSTLSNRFINEVLYPYKIDEEDQERIKYFLMYKGIKIKS